jgi:transposase
MKTLTWEHPAEAQVVADYLLAITQLQARLTDLDTHLAELADSVPYAEPVAWLRCFRGIDTLTAMTIVAELHDFRRFVTPRALMAYLGLVPSEHSSGGRPIVGASRKPATDSCGACSPKPRGTISIGRALDARCRSGASASRRP